MIRVLDLFAGAGGFTLAGEMAGGYSTVAFCEIDKHAQKVLRKNWPGVPIWDDVTKLKGADVGAVDLITGGFPCFTSGTVIFTKDGAKPIEDIVVGDMVATHMNRYMPVIQVMNRDDADILEVRIQGSPRIHATDEHPFFVLGENGGVWVKLKDLSRGDLVALPQLEEDKSDKDFDPYLLGRWLGDGWVTRYKRKGRVNSMACRVHWCCSKDEEGDLEYEFARVGYNVTKDAAPTATKYIRQDARLGEILSDFGHGAANKKIPNWVYAKPIGWRLEFMRGYRDSDGHRKNNGWSYTTVSRVLAVGIARLIRETFGRVASINQWKNDRECIIDGRTVNELPCYQVSHSDAANHQAVYKFGQWWTPVRSVKNTGEKSAVYNFGVLQDESYIADGVVVHNCQDLSTTGKGKGLGDGTRSGLFREMLRLAGECGRPFILFENSPQLISGNGGDWFREFLRSLAEIGYDAEWTIVSVGAFGGPHERKRACVVAYPNEAPIERGGISQRIQEKHRDINRATSWWGNSCGPERRVYRMDDGVPLGAHRVRAGIMGNAIAPPVWSVVMEAIREEIEAHD